MSTINCRRVHETGFEAATFWLPINPAVQYKIALPTFTKHYTRFSILYYYIRIRKVYLHFRGNYECMM